MGPFQMVSGFDSQQNAGRAQCTIEKQAQCRLSLAYQGPEVAPLARRKPFNAGAQRLARSRAPRDPRAAPEAGSGKSP